MIPLRICSLICCIIINISGLGYNIRLSLKLLYLLLLLLLLIIVMVIILRILLLNRGYIKHKILTL